MRTEIWDRILAALGERLAAPSADLPSVRWLAEPALRRLLVGVREALAGLPGKTRLTGRRLLALLCESGLARALIIPDVPEGQKPLRLYRLGMGGVREITPLELLQAVKPSDVICYFSALQFHELTTQVTPHHHIARLEAVTKRDATWVAPDTVLATPAQREGGVHAADGELVLDRPLGTLMFRHEGVPYYWTRRDRALVPGVQWVRLSPETMVHITTLEQTLLDTLHRPWSCGGPAVVFEAWEHGASRLDAERMAEYLRAIERPVVCRRAGYMLEHCGYRIADTDLGEVLRQAKANAANEPMSLLLPEVPASALNPAWNLGVPG